MALEFDNRSLGYAIKLEQGVTIVDTQFFRSMTVYFSYDNGTSVAVVGGNEPDLSDGTTLTADDLQGFTSFTTTGFYGDGLGISDATKYRYFRVDITNPVANTDVIARVGHTNYNPAFNELVAP